MTVASTQRRARRRIRYSEEPNTFPGVCARCGQDVPAGWGTFFPNPLRLICSACVLFEGVRPNGLKERLTALPRKVTITKRDGTEQELVLNLHQFQVEDATRIERMRAMLISHQMGCGKTVISSMGALRPDMANFVFTPASVRENWAKEIERWRSDLRVSLVETQTEFRDNFDRYQHSPGVVALASFGILPGSPCSGCVSLRSKLKELKKAKRYSGSSFPCVHDGNVKNLEQAALGADPIVNDHPRTIDLFIDGVMRRLPYHFKGPVDEWLQNSREIPRGMKPPELELTKAACEGCHQANPLPLVTKPVLLLADECHAFKEPGSQRTKNWRALREAVWRAGGYTFGLSGTPCEGKPMEFWEVLKSFGLERAAFGDWDTYYRIFKHWFDNPKGKRIAPEGELREELHRRLRRVQINRRRKDVLSQLPPRVEDTIFVEMTEKTIREVNEAVHRMLAVKRAWEDTFKGTPALRIMNPFEPRLTPDERERRRSIYNDRVDYYFKERPWNKDVEIIEAVEHAMLYRDQCPAIDELSKIRAMLSQAKMAAVQQWISDREEEEEPVVLFSSHVQILKKIAENRPGWACFHGGLSHKQRQAMVEAFQNGDIQHGLAVSSGAGGEGITLTRAGVCGFIDLAWNPSKVQQCESRLIRIGAEKHQKIVVVRFVAKHVVDDLVVKTLAEKEKLLDALEWDEGEAA